MSARRACSKILKNAGVRNMIGVDRLGAIYKGRDGGDVGKTEWYVENTNFDRVKGTLEEVLEGADLFLGVASAGLVQPEWLKKMNRDPIVFALANPGLQVPARKGGALRCRDGDGPVRLSQPDQQRALLPGDFPRSHRLPRHRYQRRNEVSGRATPSRR